MLYFSSILHSPEYRPAAENLFSALKAHGVKYDLLPNTRDIWMRDFMPVRRKDGKYVSFRYEPTYLNHDVQLRTAFRKDISGQFWSFDSDFGHVIYSDINLDGGNVVFSPSRETVVISERVLAENPGIARDELTHQLEELLMAKVILIPALPLAEDMTGHADGMVRFVDEHTVLGNDVPEDNGLEQEIKKILERHGIRVIDFPYYSSQGISAEGCYLNYLETYKHIFLPVFGKDMDQKAIQMANEIFSKQVVPVRINEIAKEGGCLNCISWEIDPRDAIEYKEDHFPVVTCPVCGTETLGMDCICPRCGWEQDGAEEDSDFSSANGMTVEAYRNIYRKKSNTCCGNNKDPEVAKTNCPHGTVGDNTSKGIEHVSKVISRIFDWLKEFPVRESNEPLQVAKDSVVSGISTGFPDLDQIIAGLNKSDLILMAAQPCIRADMGLNMLLHAGKFSGKAVVFFSSRMSREQVAMQLISSEGFVDFKNLMSGQLNEDDRLKVTAASMALNQTELYIDDPSLLSVPDMKAKCHRIDNLGLVVIDYLQLITSADGNDHHKRRESRQKIPTDVLRNLKTMAEELRVPVVCLCHLSRANKMRMNKHPGFSESIILGGNERHIDIADVVMFLRHDDDVDGGDYECVVTKNRRGKTGVVELIWIPMYAAVTAVVHQWPIGGRGVR